MSDIQTELKVFDPIQAGLNALTLESKSLVVKDCNDKAGYTLVRAFRNQKLVKLRTSVDAERQRIKGFYLDAGRAVDARAKEIEAEIRKIEEYCKTQEKIVDDEIARVRSEKERIAKERIDEFVAKLRTIEVFPDMNFLGICTDDQFSDLLKTETEKYQAKKLKEQQEKVELERLRKEREENNKIVEAEKFKAEQARSELLKLQQIELDKQRAKAAKAEQEKQEAELRLSNERKAAEEKEKQRKLVEQQAQAAEQKRLAQIEAERIKKEKEAAKKIADKKLFESIKAKFPTLESAWIEIARLMKEAGYET